MDIFYFVFDCHIVLSVSCSLVITFWERADHLALLYVMFSCVFVTFPYEFLGQVWYLIESIPDLRLHPYYDYVHVQFFIISYGIILPVFSKDEIITTQNYQLN